MSYTLLLFFTLNGQPSIQQVPMKNIDLCQKNGKWLATEYGKQEFNDGRHFWLSSWACVRSQ